MTRKNAAACPVTPEGRHFVVRGRLWRMADPRLPEDERQQLVKMLMAARRAVDAAKRAGDKDEDVQAGHSVDATKRALGERGPAWREDDAPDLGRHMVRTTHYAQWFEAVCQGTSGNLAQ